MFADTKEKRKVLKMKLEEKNISGGERIEGWVSSVERFSVHDGPGIRTLVFLKGCPLRCLWCDNPESQLPRVEIAEFQSRCVDCGNCVKICPSGAISKNNWKIDRNLCTACGKCAEVCPSRAREAIGVKRSAESVVEEVEKDRLFYENSGGVTLSGGEPLMQPAFSREIVKACKNKGVHTAIETCGYNRWSDFEEILPFLDLILYDIKHMDPKQHQKYTGKSNQLILRNFTKLVQIKFPMVIRIPLIPGYNDTMNNINSIVKLLKPLRHLQRIDILPYHKLGTGKYERLGREYKLAKVNSPDESSIQKIKQIFESRGYKVGVGDRG